MPAAGGFSTEVQLAHAEIAPMKAQPPAAHSLVSSSTPGLQLFQDPFTVQPAPRKIVKTHTEATKEKDHKTPEDSSFGSAILQGAAAAAAAAQTSSQTSAQTTTPLQQRQIR